MASLLFHFSDSGPGLLSHLSRKISSLFWWEFLWAFGVTDQEQLGNTLLFPLKSKICLYLRSEFILNLNYLVGVHVFSLILVRCLFHWQMNSF
jgi:hypothetical protein